MKSFKDLFIKSDSEEENASERPSFPSSETNQGASLQQPSSTNPYLAEIIEIYEKGLESINMPGYDFYDFYTAVRAAGAQNEAVYKIAFQMGRTMDSSITPQKLADDAEYYLSKINEVYQRYSDQGKQKLDGLSKDLRNDKENLSNEISRIESDISKLRQQIQSLERKLGETKGTLSKVDERYKPQQEVIQLKLNANANAMQLSLQRLNATKEAILKYLK